jgi:REP element-mobilizing transposase RayT
MPRGPRDDAPGVAHHVMARGIERRPIFLDDVDRADFLRRLTQLTLELGFLCFAWVLMSNHFHLVVRSGHARLSQLMARLTTGYAVSFNRRHDRVGHLFQNRFRSRRVVDDADLLGLVLYVCRNPLEAGLVATPRALELFPWCGLGALVAARPPHPFEAVGETLELFDAERARARRRLRSRLCRAPMPHPELALSLATVTPPAASVRPTAVTLDEALRQVCDGFGVTLQDLRSRRRSPTLVAARSALAWRAVSADGISGSEVARALGVTRTAVSLMLERERARGPHNFTTSGTSP